MYPSRVAGKGEDFRFGLRWNMNDGQALFVMLNVKPGVFIALFQMLRILKITTRQHMTCLMIPLVLPLRVSDDSVGIAAASFYQIRP